MILVVDASVAAKWFLPEPLSAQAVQLLEERFDLVAPDLLRLEVGNVLVRATRMKAIGIEDAAKALARLASPDIEIVPSGPLIEPAFALAADHGGTTYDAVYLALARSLNAAVVTCDEQMVVTAKRARIAVRLIERL